MQNPLGDSEVAQDGYPESFSRMWEYCFTYCDAGFTERPLGDLQMVLSREEQNAARMGCASARLLSPHVLQFYLERTRLLVRNEQAEVLHVSEPHDRCRNGAPAKTCREIGRLETQ
jgi:hypothetical protein